MKLLRVDVIFGEWATRWELMLTEVSFPVNDKSVTFGRCTWPNWCASTVAFSDQLAAIKRVDQLMEGISPSPVISSSSFHSNFPCSLFGSWRICCCCLWWPWSTGKWKLRELLRPCPSTFKRQLEPPDRPDRPVEQPIPHRSTSAAIRPINTRRTKPSIRPTGSSIRHPSAISIRPKCPISTLTPDSTKVFRSFAYYFLKVKKFEKNFNKFI